MRDTSCVWQAPAALSIPMMVAVWPTERNSVSYQGSRESAMEQCYSRRSLFVPAMYWITVLGTLDTESVRGSREHDDRAYE